MKTLDEIRSSISTLESIPAIPAIVQPLVATLNLPAEKVAVEQVVELVSYDSSIAAQCLRMANSPLFGRRNVETVKGAIVTLGLKRVQSILLGCCLNRIVPMDKWAFSATSFWRHSLGCALVSRKLASLIGYPEPEKAYLAGLLHDIGILVNTLACTKEYCQCFAAAGDRRVSLEVVEQNLLGFTHCESGRILAEQWKFPQDVVAVIAFHHHVAHARSAPALVCLVHLCDLLCRLRDLGYGFYEAMGVDLAGDRAWADLLEHCPQLATLDLTRLTLDIDGAMDEIIAVVDAVFHPESSISR
ncbi:MAG TPA: HDOD domain-containing protein [Candidatus Binatia bacterium]|nr:HDOD domain-containing protein [Candidatus Sulfotelmatobacter sp.]HXJ85965.1 HDOD domain-containing protein [Candidatus Binatia bacterium]